MGEIYVYDMEDKSIMKVIDAGQDIITTLLGLLSDEYIVYSLDDRLLED